jgi:hypothetical protein
VSHFKPACSDVAACGLSGSSKYLVVPFRPLDEIVNGIQELSIPGTDSMTRSSKIPKPILRMNRRMILQ